MRAMSEPVSTVHFGVVLGKLTYYLAALSAAVVVIVLLAPVSRKQHFAILIVTVLTSIYGGPVAVAYLDVSAWEESARVGVCFLTGIPSYVILSVIITSINTLQGKTPEQLRDVLKSLLSGRKD